MTSRRYREQIQKNYLGEEILKKIMEGVDAVIHALVGVELLQYIRYNLLTPVVMSVYILEHLQADGLSTLLIESGGIEIYI